MATSIIIFATADATIGDGTNANTNFGSLSTVKVGTVNTGTAQHFRGVYRFSLATVPSGALVVDAGITLNANGSQFIGNPAFQSYRVTQPAWTETGVTWNRYDGATVWATSGGDYSPSNPGVATLSSTADDMSLSSMATQVTAAIDAGSTAIDVLVIGPEGNIATTVFIGDARTGGTPPILQVAYELREPLFGWTAPKRYREWSVQQ